MIIYTLKTSLCDVGEGYFSPHERGAMKIFTATMAVGWLLLPSMLSANDCNNDGQLGVVRTLSAMTRGKSALTIGGGFTYATDAAYVKGPDGAGAVLDRSGAAVTDAHPAKLLSGNVFAAYGVSDLCDVSVGLPVYDDVSGWGPSENGIGDLEIAAKLKDPYKLTDAFIAQAYYLKVIVPTGRESRGFFPRHSYYINSDSGNAGSHFFSAGEFFLNPMLTWTFDFTRLSRRLPMLLDANVGGMVGNVNCSLTAAVALALEVRASPWLMFFIELSGESRIKRYVSTGAFAADPLRLTPGLRLNLPRGFYCTLAGDGGLSEDYPSFRTDWNREGYRYSTRAVPRWGGQISFGWAGRLKTPDRDKDSIPDSLDKCPDVPEDKDGFEDSDGCPDYDNDRDGIPDSLDKCPNLPEDIDGFQDSDGCPDYDNDRDGIPDSLDKCPDVAEDKDNFEDEDGCPDYDNDRDGIPDSLDKCPNLPEDIDGFQDSDGCPDYDNDADGVPDAVDRCPMVAGPADSNGCPVSQTPAPAATRRGPLILNSVTFENGKALLTPKSRATLDQVALSLLEWIDVKLEIQGYSDVMEASQKLSQQRAEAVKDYLIHKSIAADRLKAMGYGSKHPLFSSISALGRQKNRRVELHRIE
jgi:outer membrane protein OmpA-like peptidoglycan-associated protein